MLEKYKVVYKGGQDEIIEKKSRFIATVAPVERKNIGMRDITVLRMSSEREDSLQDAVMTENLAALPENLCWMFFLGKKSAI